MVDSNGGSTSDAKEFYEDEKQLMKLCDFLRSSEGPPVREAIEMDKRVYYIKGEYLFVDYMWWVMVVYIIEMIYIMLY